MVCGKVSVLVTYANEDIEGMVIVAEGANDINVKTDIVSATEAVTGLGKHKIKVYEMKGEEESYGQKD